MLGFDDHAGEAKPCARSEDSVDVGYEQQLE